MQIDPAFTLKTLQEVVGIDSRNPGLEEGGPGEWELAHHITGVLRGFGWQADVQDLGKPRANVVARWPGTGGGKSLMINVHLDTVGTEGMPDPYGAKIRDGKVHGRGTQDTKGGVAAAIAVAKLIADAQVQLKGDLVLAFVADEEHESIGTERLIEQVKTDAAIVLEPSDLDVVIAHRGFGAFQIETKGQAAHGGRSDIGIDANLHMGHVLMALHELQQEWRQRKKHPLLDSATLHVPLLSGGRQLFVYADHCTLNLECRTVPGQTMESILAELEAILERFRNKVPDFQATVEAVQWRAPYSIDPEADLVQTVLKAATEVRNEPAKTIAHPWWEDSAILGAAGIESVIIGPTGGGMHTDGEWVDGESVVRLAKILFASVLAYCGRADEGTR
ncbi:MAG: M20/M25/M40 family metallo-hydrolase [Euryarchaeota archaeon]|nr:M20/M25/M40 family metallo-hydrolase [Euryarchaeota archaeon]